MTLDNGWALIISTCIGVFLMWLGAVVGKHFSDGEKETDDAHARVDALEKRVSDQELAHQKYQTYVAENYVKNAVIERMESKLMGAIASLEKKIDRFYGSNKP